MRHLRTIGAVGVLLLVGSTAPAQFRPIGSFDNVRQSTGEESHCYGYSLELWRHNRSIVGLLDRHEGLCGDPPCEALRDVTHDPGTGRLTFSALDQKFTGTLRRDDVVGTLNSARVRLARDRNFPLDSDQGFSEWCEFWRGVRRCRGVDEVCRSSGK